MARRRDARREVFLSYSARDSRFSEKLRDTLRSHGVEVWFAPRKLLPAQKWHSEIGRALARCNWFAVVLSKNSVRSEWVERELVYDLAHKQYTGRILPVLKEPCHHERLSWTLQGFQFVNFTESFNDGCRQLLKTWGIELRTARPGRGRSSRSQ